MSQISRTYTFTDGTNAYGSQVESEIGGLVTAFNNQDSGAAGWTLVRTADGSISAPTFSFINDTDTGFYRAGANIVGVAAGGAQIAQFSATSFIPVPDNAVSLGTSGGFGWTQCFVKNGTAGAPSYTFRDNATTGLYVQATNALGLASNGVLGLTITASQSVVPGSAALATTATDGFIYLESCAGAPTGVPTTFTGRVACIYDTSNNKFYAYNGAWKGVVLS